MIFKDILPDHPINEIEVRIHVPGGEDLLIGFCAWDMRDLVSSDGKVYDRWWLIEDYMVTASGMVVWIKSTWDIEYSR